MLKQIFKRLILTSNKSLISSTRSRYHHVTVIGAGGGIGQVLSLLLKTNPLVTELVLMGIKNTAGIAADLSHIDTFSRMKSFTGIENTEKSLECSKIVVVAAGVPRSGKATRDDVFDANKHIIYNVTSLKAKVCPAAFMVIITNPLNALVPLAAETLKQANAYDAKKLFGLSKLDTVRARTFIGDFLLVDPRKVTVSVIGGHSDTTIVPVLSSASPSLHGDLEDWIKIYSRVRQAGTHVVKASGGKKSAQLSIAYAASTFCGSLLKALDGKSGISDVAYVESNVCPEVNYFSSKFDINKDGIKQFHTLPRMNDYERELLQKAIPDLQKNIEKGIEYVRSKKK